MNKYILILLVLWNFSFAYRNEWSTTPIDNFINNYFKRMTFREPLYLIPYDLKFGFFNYGGKDYFKNAIKGNFDLDSNPIILDNKDIDNLFISSINSRTGFFIELDIMKYNLLERLYHQNLIDLHIGTGVRYSNILSNPIAPIYIQNTNNNTNYRFRPSIIDGFINLSSIIQYSPKFYFYSYYSFGLSYAFIYESLSQKKYISGTGFNENVSIGYKYLIKRDALPYNYAIGLEFRIGRTYINEIHDDKNETPIIALDMNKIGLFFTFGTVFGGKETRGDKAYSMMLDKDYINAANKFKQFLNVYNYNFRHDEAKKMLNFCYTQIPYQYFDMAVSLFNDSKYDESLINFNRAEQIADPELILEIESYKRDIAQHIINQTNDNLDKNTFSKSMNSLDKARKISPYLWSKTDQVEAKILIKKGDILNNLNNYYGAIDYYKEALELDPRLFVQINDKYTELVINILNDINDTTNPNELKLVKDYLNIIIDLKPQSRDFFNKFIIEINQKLSNYESSITKFNLKEYVAQKKQTDSIVLSNQITIGMTMNEIELILGIPTSTVIEGEYELWIYHLSNTEFSTYFFKDYILMKID